MKREIVRTTISIDTRIMEDLKIEYIEIEN